MVHMRTVTCTQVARALHNQLSCACAGQDGIEMTRHRPSKINTSKKETPHSFKSQLEHKSLYRFVIYMDRALEKILALI